MSTKGQARYEELVAICRAHGVLTPEDPYLEWPGAPGTFIVPMFLLFDYTFRPEDVPADDALDWARESGVVSGDEQMLDPSPWPSRAAWCHARCDRDRGAARRAAGGLAHRAHQSLAAALRPGAAAARAALLDLVRHDAHRGLGASAIARSPSSPAICICARRSGGTACATRKCRSAIRATGAQDRGIEWYLREILPGTGPDAQRFEFVRTIRFADLRFLVLDSRSAYQSARDIVRESFASWC